jgi:hypothetical protein
MLSLLPTAALAKDSAAKTAGTISIWENPTKIYDTQAAISPSVQTNSDGGVSYTYYKAGANGTWTALNGAPADAGSYAVTAKVAETAHYASAATEKYPFTIVRRPVALGLSTSYSGDELTVTAAVLGAVNAAGSVDFTFTPQSGTAKTISGQSITENSGIYTAEATLHNISAGTYTVTASYVPGTPDNYTCALPSSISFDRSKETRSINCDDTFSKTYNGTDASFNLDATASAYESGDSDTFAFEVVNDSYADYGLAPTASVDSSGIVTIHNAGTSFIKIVLTDSYGHYNEADAYVKVQVNPAALTVKSQVKSGGNAVAYGTAGSLTCSLSYSGFLNSDTADTFTGGHGTLAALPLNNFLNAGKHAVEIARRGDSTSLTINGNAYSNIFLCRNYALTYEKASLTVTKATPTVSTLDQTVTIGWGLSRLTVPVSATGVNGETVPGAFTWSESSSGAALGSGYAFSGSAGETKPLYWTFTPTDGTNYAAATGRAVFTLKDKTTVTLNGLAAPSNRVYTGSAVQSAEFGAPTDYTGTLTYTYYTGGTLLPAAPTGAGNYTVRVSVPESDSDCKGYKDIPFSIAKCTGVLSDITFAPESAHRYGSYTTVSATIKNENGIALAGLRAEVTFKNGGFSKSYSVTSDGSGLLTQTTDILLPVGTYTVTISFCGDDNCSSVTKTAGYTVAAASSGASSGGSDGMTAEVKVETGKTGEAVAAALIEAPATATTTTLPAAVVEAVTGADTAELTVRVGEVSVALDKAAVEAVRAVGGETPTLSATPVAAKDLPTELQGATKAYDLRISGKSVSFGGGSAVVSIPYAKTDSSKVAAVYYIDANGNKTRVYGATLTAGGLSIPISGWSTYAVLEVAPTFTDVRDTDWFYGSVQYAADKGLFKGTSATAFSPNVTMTRGMLVTVLWRMAGSPAMDDYGYPYSDVNAVTNPYAPAIYWARAQKLVTGYSDDVFGPDDAVTREQLVSILYRYAKLRAYDTAQGGMAIREFADYASVSAYASEAMGWAVSAGLLNGSDGKLLPQNGASRAQVAAVLMRAEQLWS